MSAGKLTLSVLHDYSHFLPDTAQNLVQLIGMDKTLALVEGLGGTSFPVPKNKRSTSDVRYSLLCQTVGIEAADKLVQFYGGAPLYIPSCRAALRSVRNIMILREYESKSKEGYSARHIVAGLALQFKVADRQIWDILNKTEAELLQIDKKKAKSNQLTLF